MGVVNKHGNCTLLCSQTVKNAIYHGNLKICTFIGGGRNKSPVIIVSPSKIPAFIAMADVLVSPRLSGTNTPLKIYSFLKSGKPVVATRLWTHTQVLNDKISILVNTDAESLAKGISFALEEKEAKLRGQAAKELAEREYTYPRYLEKIREVLEKASRNPLKR